MKAWIGAAAAFVLVAATAHMIALDRIPKSIMADTLDRLDRGGERVNTWIHAPGASPEQRTVVRPSPDLAYSLCIWELDEAPLRISLAAWPSYWSLSLYADNTDNFAVWNDREHADGIEILLIGPGAEVPAADARVVEAPSSRGLALSRRLLQDNRAGPDALAEIREQDQCEIQESL